MVTIDRIEKPLLNVGHYELYNLGFGDLKIRNNEWILDDSTRTNNGDMSKVIATVVQIAVLFLREHKDAILFFQGYWDSKSIKGGRNQRNLLYQRAIESNWEDFTNEFVIRGVISSKIIDYVNGDTYDEILIRCKI
ncbi:hypothetical protein SAMN05216327_106214 [Dyadobacter sp. SG02]|nr:hypothetical protein SAMN05216327_106214 [Dyadobacter sp. SG02]